MKKDQLAMFVISALIGVGLFFSSSLTLFAQADFQIADAADVPNVRIIEAGDL